MIEVTLLGKEGKSIFLNPHHIEYAERREGTLLVMLSGKKIMITEKYEVLYQRIVAYRRQIGPFKNEE